MCAVFVGIAVIAGVAASVVVDQFRSAVTAPQSDGGRRITIARDSVEKTLSADDAAKREAEVLRQHRAEEQRTAARISREALLLGDIAYGAAEADVRALYGAPLETESERSMRYAGKAVVEYEYGDHLSLDFVDGFVRLVKVSERSTLASGKGVCIGTPVEELRRVYGEPSMVYGEDYIYFSEEDPTIGFAFEIKHGRVEEIKMGDLGL
ncbi:hypothetical protein HMPREF9334_00603 [Selenomonas infelix ATCC 43532]|uniref:Uncharacterized protein n=1 Tax=Selenomonas infelix ATCC 43532 TaxID=679201 RepID=G5GMX2_9FIRM|nr:hypothetical protein HMPREF9334_00603 [Selenomonas infelix ATCC 43532]